MASIGTPLSTSATRVLFCGGGELGKEVTIELQRLGVEVIVVDRYDNAPAMQVAHRSHTISMLDGDALRAVIEKEKPDFIVPEIEAIYAKDGCEVGFQAQRVNYFTTVLAVAVIVIFKTFECGNDALQLLLTSLVNFKRHCLGLHRIHSGKSAYRGLIQLDNFAGLFARSFNFQ